MKNIKNIITKKQILKQLKADLIGKDSYRGVTLTYSWLANQFGHFSLGFLPSLILQKLLLKYTHILNPAFVAAIIIATTWLCFELYNFLGPLLKKKQSKSHKIYIAGDADYVFQPAWANVAFDTFTDVCFFAVGAFTASLFGGMLCTEIYILIALVIILVYPVSYWFVTKMRLQYARFPTQFRLSQWKGKMQANDKQEVVDFISAAKVSTGNHLLVFGGRNTGKSPLGIGMATELAINKKACTYYTATKWYSLLSLNDAEILQEEACDVWSWRNADVLVIDDINPGDPINKDFITPNDIKAFVEQGAMAGTNKQDLKNKNIIWIMGNLLATDNKPSEWITMLQQIGIDAGKIAVINLTKKVVNH